MTFSVDPDFWLFQPGPRQDAMVRAEAGEGRGKDFASSLFGVRTPEKASADLAAGDSATLTLASLGLPTAAVMGQAPPALPAASTTGNELALTPATTGPTAALAGDKTALAIALPAPAEDVALPAPAPANGTAPEIVAADTPTAPPSSEEAKAGELLASAPTGTSSGDTGDEAVAEAPGHASLEAAPLAPLPVSLTAITSAPLQAAIGKSEAEARGSETIPASGAGKLLTDASSAKRTLTPVTPSASLEHQHELLADATTAGAESTLTSIGVMSFDESAPNGLGTDSASSSTPQISLFTGSSAQSLPATATSASTVTAQMTPTHTILVATAAQVPDIVARATSDGLDDRVVVQLDPPELGRISIDFKFDAQGLQHVTITAESPEAMRQLRQMHFELVQALERNGLSGQNMSFQHQNPQQNDGWGQQAKHAGTRFETPALSNGGLIIAADTSPHRQIASSGRLDIRL